LKNENSFYHTFNNLVYSLDFNNVDHQRTTTKRTTMNQSKILKRLKTEMERMTESYQQIATKEVRFLNNQHQIDYDTLKDAYDLILSLSPKEFYEYKERIERKENDLKRQKPLF